jgi:uncharacterized protein YneF (UPF0154 family)
MATAIPITLIILAFLAGLLCGVFALANAIDKGWTVFRRVEDRHGRKI